jgi:electron transfer flavoprotein alpha subunit
MQLEDAKVIVAGGGGLGAADGFNLVSELAKALNAAVGATRAPVDEKWVPHHMEIGQTGKIVSPDVYIAVGISGATQHVTGILGSGKIVAINKDPEANIFRIADYGWVADYKKALPLLIESLK